MGGIGGVRIVSCTAIYTRARELYIILCSRTSRRRVHLKTYNIVQKYDSDISCGRAPRRVAF